MLFIPTEVRPSPIFGRGLFLTHPLQKGAIIASFTLDTRPIVEDEFIRHITRGDPAITRTGTRYIGKYFTITDDTDSNLNYFNHSFEPNCLVHCGIVLARRDLPAETELTIDYRTLVDASDVGTYADAVTGRVIKGYTARQTLLRTAAELIELINTLPDWEPAPPPDTDR
ncbi:MAG: SET domain-containing protein [Phycisphaerales bacterium]|nr:SET domain-containing protein [Phycisphaerales bacterium]